MNIYDLISRAQKLRKETQLDSVSPDRVGGLQEDTLKYINEFQLLASSPSLHKIYASVSAMQADAVPKSDLTGKTLKLGQLVVIAPANQSDATAGDVYRYDGPSGNTSAWTFVAKIGGVPADADLNATSANPVQNKVVTEKLTELSEEVGGLSGTIKGQTQPTFELTTASGILPSNKKPFAFKKGEFSIKVITNDVLNVSYVNVYLYDADQQQVGGILIAYEYAKTYTVDKDVAYVALYMPASQVAQDGSVQLVIEAEGIKGIEGEIEKLRNETAEKLSGTSVGVGKNLYNSNDIEVGYINVSQEVGSNPVYTGNDITKYAHCKPIPIIGGCSYYLQADSYCTAFYLMYLDANKKVVSLVINAGTNRLLETPSEASYITFTTRFNSECSNLQLSIGNKQIAYEPYKGTLSLPFEKMPIHIQVATKIALEIQPKVARLESVFVGDKERKVYASAGDSLTQGTGKAVGAIDSNDEYYPLGGTAQKTYAYMIAQRNRMAWINYGISGSTMSNVMFNGVSYNPFCIDRYNNMIDDIDVISLWFGVNDSYYGRLAKAEEWLTKTYGTKIYYPIDSAKIGTTASDGTPYATQEQYNACLNATETIDGVEYKGTALFRKHFEGKPTDTDDSTWWGAWNKVLPYLIEKYPFAKILIITGYGTETYLYESAKTIAEKYGVLHLDLREYGVTWLDLSTQPSVIDYDAADFADRTYFKEYASGKVSVNEFRKRTMLYDGLHFNKYGYEYITPFIEKALNL